MGENLSACHHLFNGARVERLQCAQEVGENIRSTPREYTLTIRSVSLGSFQVRIMDVLEGDVTSGLEVISNRRHSQAFLNAPINEVIMTGI